MNSTMDADVLVIGYGPVGMAMAATLATRGHSVTVIERFTDLYRLPRAATFDDEIMRVFDSLGIAEDLAKTVVPLDRYEWFNGDDRLLFELEYDLHSDLGWPQWNSMYQPALETLLDARCRELGVDVRMGMTVTGIEQDADGAFVTISPTGGTGYETLRAPFVVACDGGNSFTRAELGIGQTDLGFSEPWMVCDFEMSDDAPEIPGARQLGDPSQPISIIRIGPDHHRFSFMLDDVRDFDREKDPQRVWARVKDFIDPSQAKLIRVATYTFMSRIAHRWRQGRVALAGDAAHQMPPFLGQGMCSGIRDTQNLGFKISALLHGAAADSILDTYQQEREPSVEAIVRRGMELGRLQTMRDPDAVAQRDENFLAARAAGVPAEKFAIPPLGGSPLVTTTPGAGSPLPQGRVDAGDDSGLFDTVCGSGMPFVIFDAEHIDVRSLGELEMATFGIVREGVKTATPAAEGVRLVEDSDGVFGDYFERIGMHAAVVRPDAYVFGTATSAQKLRALAADYRSALRDTSSPATAAAASM